MTRFPGIGLVLLVGLLPAPARGQEPVNKPLALPADGVELFKWILQERGLRPVADLQTLRARPSRGVMILMGDPMPILELGVMQDFVAKGGALLFASDVDCEELIPTFGAFITGRLVTAKPAECYREREDFPFVGPVEDRNAMPAANCFRHSDKTPLKALVSNRPSSIRKVRTDSPFALQNAPGFVPDRLLGNFLQKGLQPVARFGPDARWNGYLGRTNPYPFDPDSNFDPKTDFAAMALEATDFPARAMLLADHSILLNQLLIRRDIDNYEFAENLVDWLKGPRGRDLCYFVFDHRKQENFELPMPEIPLPPLDVMANVALNASNKMVDRLEKDDFFNKYLLERVGWRKLLRGWLLFSTFSGLAWMLWKVWNGRSSPARGRMAPLAPSMDVADPTIRFAMQNGRNDFQPTARALVRACFARIVRGSVGGELTDRRQVLNAFPWYSLLSRSLVRKYWPIGFEEHPVRIRAAKLRRIMADLQGLEAALERRTAAALSSPPVHVPQKT